MRSRKRIRFEMIGEDGDKVILIFEGRLDREKFLQVADLIDLYGGFSERKSEERYLEGSKLAKLARAVSKYFPVSYFTSRDAVEAYIAEYREPITLSTASTYLARLSERGFLERVRAGNTIKYRLARPHSLGAQHTERFPAYHPGLED